MKKILILSLMGLSLYAYSEDVKEETKELHNTSATDNQVEFPESNELEILDLTDKDKDLEGEITVEETPFSKEITKKVTSTKNEPNINEKIDIVEKEKEEVIPELQNNKNIKEEEKSTQLASDQTNNKFEEDLENLENLDEEELQALLERLEKELNFQDIE